MTTSADGVTSLADWLRAATARLSEISETPRLDAELLAAHALGLGRQEIILALPSLQTPEAAEALLARRLAHEAETVLRGDKTDKFFQHMYGDLPDHWSENLRGVDRLRVIINAFTRLRYCDLEGNMDLRPKGPPGSQPPDLMPWFQVPGRRSQEFKIIFGHWSALGLWDGDGVIGLDSGCLWGRSLSAVRLDTSPLEFFRVDCEPYQAHDGG